MTISVPAPSQRSQRPPGTLNEKWRAVTLFFLASGVAAKALRILRAVQEQVSLNGSVIFNGFARVKLKAEILACVFQNLAIAIIVELDPTINGIFRDALALVDQAPDDSLAHHA